MTSVPAIIANLKADSAGVNAIVAGRVFTELAPEVGKTYPQIVIGDSSAETESTYDGNAGVASESVSVNCFATTKSAVAALAGAVFKLLADKAGTWGGIIVQGCFFEDQEGNSISLPELGPDAQLFSIDLKFTVWFVLP